LHSNCRLNQVIEGKIQERREDEEEDIRNYRMTFRKRGETERGSTISHSVEK
jgi:hypothetical protein